MKKKIVLIGPVYPYKGGISHYTGLMFKALQKQYDVEMYSYKFQYPKLLYKKEQKDYSNDAFKIDDTHYALHTANPFNWIAVAGKIKKSRPDAVIIQWWHPYFAPCYFMLAKLLGKIKVLFICHNVFPHERFPLDRFLTKLVMKQGDRYIVQSAQDEKDLLSIRKNAVYKKTTLPTFNVFHMKGMSLKEGREILNIPFDSHVLLFFGFVREYKGLKHLLRAMPEVLKGLKDCRLLVVGDFAGDKEHYLQMIQELKIENSIEIHDGYIPDKEVEKFFAAADLVVLPYESATQSGIVQIAYSFEKPVIATRVGGLPEVVTDGKTGYLVKEKDPQALSEAILRFFENKKGVDFRNEIQKEAYKYSWERMTEVIGELLH